jgi:putative membrane protein
MSPITTMGGRTMRHLDAVLANVDSHGWGHMDGWGGGWMWWGLAMMVILTLIFAALAVWLIRSLNLGPGRAEVGPHPGARAREILAERYARGELTTDEYRERLEQLQ